MNVCYQTAEKLKVSAELRTRIEQVILDCMEKAVQAFGEEKINQLPFLKFKTKGRCTGRARWNHITKECEIDINPVLLNENVEYVVNQTVPHEVAHIVAFMAYGRVKAHGWEWQRVMRLFGKTPNRCHQLDTETVRSLRKPREKKPRVFVNCLCPGCGKKLIITQNQANKMRKGFSYRHPACGSRLSAENLVNVFTVVQNSFNL
jgi:SprT protein